MSNPNHNHKLEGNMIAHPAAHTITQEQRATIYHHLDENIPPRRIISLIKKSDPSILITPMDVYNLRKSFLTLAHCSCQGCQADLASPVENHMCRFNSMVDKTAQGSCVACLD